MWSHYNVVVRKKRSRASVLRTRAAEINKGGGRDTLLSGCGGEKQIMS